MKKRAVRLVGEADDKQEQGVSPFVSSLTSGRSALLSKISPSTSPKIWPQETFPPEAGVDMVVVATADELGLADQMCSKLTSAVTLASPALG